jgi:hypothetical protein
MIKKVDLGLAPQRVLFAEPSPLGLLGLAIGCAALLPMTLGYGLTPAGLKTAAIFCLLFGAGCQFLAGMMCFANKNLFGGTLFTAFSFNWLANWWALNAVAGGVIPDGSVVLAVDIAMLAIFIVFTYGFGFFSKLLFLFLVDIDLLFVARLVKYFVAKSAGLAAAAKLDPLIGFFTLALAVVALWLAFAGLINLTAGKQLFKVPGPLFFAPKRAGFDWSARFNVFDALYKHWREHAFDELSVETLRQRVKEAGVERDILPELCYLQEYGALQLGTDGPSNGRPAAPKTVRLTASGIDLYEQLILRKYDFAA